MKFTKNENENPKLDTHESKIGENENEIDENQTPTKSDESNANLDDIGASLIGAMPDVQQHAIDLSATQKQANLDKYSHLVDKNGRSFDPAIHKTKRDGTPTVSKTNKLMLKPASAKNDNTNAETLKQRKLDANNSDEIVLSDAEKQQCRSLGKLSANTLFTVGRMLGGEEWTPVKNSDYNEAAALEDAFADYYISTGNTEMSPRTALTIAVLSYAVPRFTMPKTKEKSAGLFKKAYAWWHNRKGAKQERARQMAEKVRKDSEKKESTFEA
jgi:hypothetical protein